MSIFARRPSPTSKADSRQAPLADRPSFAQRDTMHAYEIAIDEVETAGPEELKQRLLGMFRSPNYKPPVLPAVALALTELSRRPNVAFNEVVATLERDPIVAAGVLRVAQSPVYSSRTSVKSLHEALNRLGLEGLRNVVWQVVSNMRLFRVLGYKPIMERLQAHSLLCAHLSRLVASHAQLPVEHAFLAGLLHDVGISGTLIAMSDGSKEKPPDLIHLWAALDRMHAEAGAMMARMWGLAPEICQVLDAHHPHPGKVRECDRLVLVIIVAEWIGDELGLALKTDVNDGTLIDRHAQATIDAALDVLQLKPKLRGIKAQAEALAKTLGLAAP